MAINTCTITDKIFEADDSIPPFARLRFELVGWDSDQNETGTPVVAPVIEFATVDDLTGEFSITLWQNGAGLRGTHYTVILERYTDINYTERAISDVKLGKIQIDAGTTSADLTTLLSEAVSTSFVWYSAITQAEYDAAIAAKDGAEEARDKAEQWAEEIEDTEVETGKYSALHHAAKSESSATASASARDKAEQWAEEPEDTEVEVGQYSALHHASKAQEFAAGLPAVDGGLGAVSAAFGQAYRELAPVAEYSGITTLALFNLASVVGQISDQVNGGRTEMTGGSLADPALRIGTAGIYSAAADTLSIAIGGAEVARFTSSGLTVYGTVTEA